MRWDGVGETGDYVCVTSELLIELLGNSPSADLVRSLMTGNLFNQFDFELFETIADDVKICHDFFAPWGPDDSKGVRVVAK